MLPKESARPRFSFLFYEKLIPNVSLLVLVQCQLEHFKYVWDIKPIIKQNQLNPNYQVKSRKSRDKIWIIRHGRAWFLNERWYTVSSSTDDISLEDYLKVTLQLTFAQGHELIQMLPLWAMVEDWDKFYQYQQEGVYHN